MHIYPQAVVSLRQRYSLLEVDKRHLLLPRDTHLFAADWHASNCQRWVPELRQPGLEVKNPVSFTEARKPGTTTSASSNDLCSSSTAAIPRTPVSS